MVGKFTNNFIKIIKTAPPKKCPIINFKKSPCSSYNIDVKITNNPRTIVDKNVINNTW